MDLNDPKQKELLARYQQQLLAQYQKQMLVQQKAKQKAAVAAKQQQHKQHAASAQPAAPKRMPRRSLDDGKAAPRSEQKPQALSRTKTADSLGSVASSSSEGLVKRLNFGTSSTQSVTENSAGPPAGDTNASGTTAVSTTTPTPTPHESAAVRDDAPTPMDTAATSSHKVSSDARTNGGKRKFGEIRQKSTESDGAADGERDIGMATTGTGQTSLAPPAIVAMSAFGKSPARKRARVLESNCRTSMSSDAPSATTSRDLVSEIANLKDENAQLKNKVKSLEELSAAHSAEKDLLAQGLNAQKGNAEKEVDALRAEVTRLVDEMKYNAEEIEKTDAALKENVSNLEKELDAERERRTSEVTELRSDKARLEELLEESNQKLVELARQDSQNERDASSLVEKLEQAEQDLALKNEEIGTQQSRISELELQINEISENYSKLESQIREFSESTPEVQEDTEMSLEIDSGFDQGLPELQLAEAREMSQKLQEHTREVQQKEALIISLGETVAELRAQLANPSNNTSESCAAAADVPLTLDSSQCPEMSEVSSQTDEPEISTAVKGEMQTNDATSLREELIRVREELTATLVEHTKLKTKLETVRSEYKTEIAALSDSYETELESLKFGGKTVNSSSVCSSSEESVNNKADMKALAAEPEVNMADSTTFSSAPISVVDVERKIKLQYEHSIADFEGQATEHASRVASLENDLQSKRDEIQRLHQQVAVFSAEPMSANNDTTHAADLKAVDELRQPIAITVRRFRQWIGGVELKYDARYETLNDFSFRAAQALQIAQNARPKLKQPLSVEEVSTKMEIGEEIHISTSTSDSSFESAADQQPHEVPAKSTTTQEVDDNRKYCLRRPGTEAEILCGTSLKSFDVVYVTTAAEEALFGTLSTQNVTPIRVCSENLVMCG